MNKFGFKDPLDKVQNSHDEDSLLQRLSLTAKVVEQTQHHDWTDVFLIENNVPRHLGAQVLYA